jgi:hypothetical protein
MKKHIRAIILFLLWLLLIVCTLLSLQLNNIMQYHKRYIDLLLILGIISIILSIFITIYANKPRYKTIAVIVPLLIIGQHKFFLTLFAFTAWYFGGFAP